MRIAITGSLGQLGSELVAILSVQHQILKLNRPSHDVTDPAIIDEVDRCRPDLVIHTAAMTDVDGCARQPDSAFRVNALGTSYVAQGCQRAEASMLYISTNEVFDGTKDSPYLEFDKPYPINPYGASKLAGEHLVQSFLQRFYIVRTAWLYGSGANFIKKVLALAEERKELTMVTDEVSTPTYAADLAQAIAKLIDRNVYGIYHLTNEGACSRFEYAQKIFELAGRKDVALRPIRREQYQRDSTPPAQSCLRNFAGQALGIWLRPWEEALSEYLSHYLMKSPK
ncbi:MAG: dTDP-4-dehydrorhamnose reductase [Chloroflexi bacterium]|nr:dTDP-4-dehydrorhamnose reductase [Chloroflexota bacterium]